jgi:hypothetical protein
MNATKPGNLRIDGEMTVCIGDKFIIASRRPVQHTIRAYMASKISKLFCLKPDASMRP